MKTRNAPKKLDAMAREVEALKKRVAELEAARVKDLFTRPLPTIPTAPTVNPHPWIDPLPYIPFVPHVPAYPFETRGHGGMCACPECCPPVWCGTADTKIRFTAQGAAAAPQIWNLPSGAYELRTVLPTANAGCAGAINTGQVWVGTIGGAPPASS